MGPIALVADDIAEGRLVQPFSEPALPPWRYFTRGLGTRERRRGAGIQDWLKVAGNTAAPGVRN